MTKPFPAYQGDDEYVFVCYAHEDADVVYPELLRLRSEGVNVWYDEGITPGEVWSENLARAIDGATRVLFFVSPGSARSRHCLNEVQYAVSHGKDIVAVHLVPTRLPAGLELTLGATQAVLRYDCERPDYERKLHRALSTATTAVSAVAALAPGVRGKRVLAPLLALAVLAGAAVTWWRFSGSPSRDASPFGVPSIAVVPFTNLVGDDDFFSAGIAEEILNLLTRTPDLRVISRDAAFAFDGGLADIADALQVDFVLDGSVRRRESQFRVIARLVDVRSRAHVWSDDFEGDLSDVFAAQQDIARDVAGALEVVVSLDAAGELADLTPQAVEHYLRGRAALRASASLENARLAQSFFARALAVHPEFVQGLAGMCHAKLVEYARGFTPESYRSAEADCSRVLESDHLNTPALVALGDLHWKAGKFVEAERVLDRARRQSPYYEPTYFHLGRAYEGQGRLDEAEAAFERSVALAPEYWAVHLGFGNFLARHRRYDESIASYLRVVETSPDDPVGYASLGIIHYEEGRLREARDYLLRSLEHGEDSRTYFNLGLTYAALDENELAIEALQKSIALNPDNQRAVGALGVAYQRAGRSDEAGRYLLRAAEQADALAAIDPSDGYVLSQAALYHAHLGDFGAARARVERALQIGAGNSRVRYNAASVLYQAGDRDGALEEIRAALALDYPPALVMNDPIARRFVAEDPALRAVVEAAAGSR